MNLPNGEQGRAIWLEAAADPEIAAIETRVGELDEAKSRHYRLRCELSDYYWNTGVPYVALEPDCHVGLDNMGWGDMRMSFAWDRPKANHDRTMVDNILRRGRFLNDRVERGRTIHDVSADIRIVEKDGKQFLVKDKKHVISPKFDEVAPLDDGRFAVTYAEHTGTMRLLTADMREGLLAKRREYDELDAAYMDKTNEMYGLQYRAALATLAIQGITLDRDQIYTYANAQDYCFNYAGSHVLMNVNGSLLTVKSWGEELTPEQRHEVWQAYDGGDNSVRSLGVQLDIMKRVIDKGVPDSLKPYEDRIMAEIEETDAASHFFLDAMRELFERNNFRPFTIETPHTSWSIPVALKLIEMPFDEAVPITAPFGTITGGHLKINRPGEFYGGYKPGPTQTWALDDKNILREKS